jgi:hypothetical protein
MLDLTPRHQARGTGSQIQPAHADKVAKTAMSSDQVDPTRFRVVYHDPRKGGRRYSCRTHVLKGVSLHVETVLARQSDSNGVISISVRKEYRPALMPSNSITAASKTSKPRVAPCMFTHNVNKASAVVN